MTTRTPPENQYDLAHYLVDVGFWDASALPVHTVQATCTFSMPNTGAEACVRNNWFDGICGNCNRKSRIGPRTTTCPKCGAAINTEAVWSDLFGEADRIQELRDYWADQ